MHDKTRMFKIRPKKFKIQHRDHPNVSLICRVLVLCFKGPGDHSACNVSPMKGVTIKIQFNVFFFVFDTFYNTGVIAFSLINFCNSIILLMRDNARLIFS